MRDSFAYGFIGGCLIGFSSLLAMWATGKVPGISGAFGRLFRPRRGDTAWRVLFLLGLIVGAAVLVRLNEFASIYRVPEGRTLAVFAIGGLLVGFGTRIGGGCTSGHGVCGVGMGARDSIVATGVFVLSGMVAVFLFGLIAGGG